MADGAVFENIGTAITRLPMDRLGSIPSHSDMSTMMPSNSALDILHSYRRLEAERENQF